ncbi:hypothetical protein [Flavobacterium sp. J372]|nr:hypothetical protein [Flavobacterium sp. J372]
MDWLKNHKLKEPPAHHKLKEENEPMLTSENPNKFRMWNKTKRK